MFKLSTVASFSFFLMKVTESFDPSLNLLGRFEVFHIPAGKPLVLVCSSN